MALQFTSASQESLENGVKILTYGGAGIGKTVLVATMPSPVMLSAESGLLSLQRSNLERMFGVNNPSICYDVPVIKITTVDDLTDALRWVTTSNEARQFASVGMDSLSEIGEVVLNNAKRQVKDPRQAYGELIEKMETTIRAYRDIQGKHVYMSAKMEPFKDELTGVVKYGPSMPGSKLAGKLPYFFDFVFALRKNKSPQGEEFRFLQTQPDMQFEAKDRSGRLDPMEYPHLGQLIAKVYG